MSYLNDTNFSTTIYFGFNTPRSNLIRLSLRPYLKIPITNINYQDLDINLNEQATVSDSSGRPLLFGLRIIFTNG